MDEAEILTAFHYRRAHYDTYLQANDIQLSTCPGCGFPSLEERNCFDICDVCNWEDDGQDDHADSILDQLHTIGIHIAGPNGNLSLTENRINIGRILETNAELVNGEIDLDTARVLKTIAFYQQRRNEVRDRTEHDHPHDHIRMEYGEVRKDLQMALIVPKG